MTHLKIELNNGIIEEVSSAVIDKLYDIVHSGNLDNTSNLIGRLHTSATYQDYIDYLEDTFKVNGVKLLIIDATKKYMTFADSVVASYWANSTYGDGVGLTETEAAAIISWPKNGNNTITFNGNTSITSFNELYKFINLTTIPNGMFDGCSNLTSIRLDNITTLADGYIFQNCNLTGVLNLPKLTSAGRGEFEGNILLEEINIGSDVPELLKITLIGSASFQSCTSLRKVTGLSKLINLSGSLFSNCSSLEEVDVNPTGTISYSFMNCSSLTCINIANATSIDYRAFLNCSSLLDLNTSDPQLVDSSTPRINTLNTTSIGSSAFDGTLLTNVKLNLPNTTSLSDGCFKNTLIIEVSIPSCTSIRGSFYGCTRLTTVNSTSNVTNIYENSFRGCTNLTTIDLSNVQTLGNLSFYQCTSLTSVDLSSCTSIGFNSFDGCTSLQLVTFNNGINLNYSGLFSGCSSLTTINGENIAQLGGEEVFKNCTSLVSIDLSSCTKIGNRVFWACSALTTVKFGSNLDSIGTQAFYACSNLTTIQVPSAKLSDYQAAFPDLASKMVAY